MAILLIFGLVGLKRGLIMTVFSICSLLITIVLTVLISPYVSTYMKENEKTHDFFYNKVDEAINLELSDSGAGEEYIDSLDIPGFMKTSIKESGSALYEGVSAKAEDFENRVCEAVTGFIIGAVAFLVTFIIVYILLKIISHLLNLVSKLPVLKQINGLLGLVAGLAEGYIVISLLGIILAAISATEFGNYVLLQVNDSVILSYVYDHNLIINALSCVPELFA